MRDSFVNAVFGVAGFVFLATLSAQVDVAVWPWWPKARPVLLVVSAFGLGWALGSVT